MRGHGQVPRAFWLEPEVRAMDDAQRVLALYLMAGPHTNSLGCFYCPRGYIATDLGWGEARLSGAMSALQTIGWATFDEDTSYVHVTRFLEHERAANANVGKHVASMFHELPPSRALRGRVAKALDRYGTHLPKGFLEEITASYGVFETDDPPPNGVFETVDQPPDNGFETVSKGFHDPGGTVSKQEQEQEHDQEQEQGHDKSNVGSATAHSAATPAPLRPPFLTMPVIGGGPEEPIQVAEVEQWKRTYPALDVPAKLAHLRTWLVANPDRRKTRKGLRRFIVNVLGKDQDRASGGPGRGGGAGGSVNRAAADAFAGGGRG